MSFPVGGDAEAGPCPSSHPIRLPHIFMENNYDLSSLVGKFDPTSFVLSNGDPTGYSFHADFFNGWTPGILPAYLGANSTCYEHDIDGPAGAGFATI